MESIPYESEATFERKDHGITRKSVEKNARRLWAQCHPASLREEGIDDDDAVN